MLITHTDNDTVLSLAFVPGESETVARLDSYDRIHSSGGEAWAGDLKIAEYTLHLGGLRIVLTPEQAVKVVTVLGDHLILCGHEFQIVLKDAPSIIHKGPTP